MVIFGQKMSFLGILLAAQRLWVDRFYMEMVRKGTRYPRKSVNIHFDRVGEVCSLFKQVFLEKTTFLAQNRVRIRSGTWNRKTGVMEILPMAIVNHLK